LAGRAAPRAAHAVRRAVAPRGAARSGAAAGRAGRGRDAHGGRGGAGCPLHVAPAERRRERRDRRDGALRGAERGAGWGGEAGGGDRARAGRGRAADPGGALAPERLPPTRPTTSVAVARARPAFYGQIIRIKSPTGEDIQAPCRPAPGAGTVGLSVGSASGGQELLGPPDASRCDADRPSPVGRLGGICGVAGPPPRTLSRTAPPADRDRRDPE